MADNQFTPDQEVRYAALSVAASLYRDQIKLFAREAEPVEVADLVLTAAERFHVFLTKDGES